MPTATDAVDQHSRPCPPGALPLQRRAWLTLALGSVALPGAGAAARREAPMLAAAWDRAAGAGHRVGTLRAGDSGWQVHGEIEVPTRAHGLWQTQDGLLLSVARRPGDWLLRWTPEGRPLAWCWIDADRAFNGHVVQSPDGRTLYTTETDLASGAGLVVMRDARSLARLDEWPTHGLDPHELLFDRDGTLLVANGGIPTRPESGRSKLDLSQMDASLVRLDPRDGRRLGQWRVADRRLSLRHLAWHGKLLGIAMQAEHDDPLARLSAPVLAVFDGRAIDTFDAPLPLHGYGGDIEGTSTGFAVSCPRADGVACWRADGRWQGLAALPRACALAPGNEAGTVVAGGHGAVIQLDVPASPARRSDMPDTLRLDNHWIGLRR